MQDSAYPYIFFPVTDSSNAAAWRLIKEHKATEGGIVHAGFQTQGKGQAGSRWESTEGSNLTFSLVLQPGFLAPGNQFLLNMVISLGVRKAVVGICHHQNVLIKWPNDIYFQGKKLGGILIENSISGQQMKYTVAGIGLNVNQEVFSSDVPNPVSLRHITGKTFDIKEILHAVCQSVFKWYQLLKKGNDEYVYQAYYSSLLGYRTRMRYMAGGRSFTAVITGVNPDGKLLLQTAPGNVLVFDFKEVIYAGEALNLS